MLCPWRVVAQTSCQATLSLPCTSTLPCLARDLFKFLWHCTFHIFTLFSPRSLPYSPAALTQLGSPICWLTGVLRGFTCSAHARWWAFDTGHTSFGLSRASVYVFKYLPETWWDFHIEFGFLLSHLPGSPLFFVGSGPLSCLLCFLGIIVTMDFYKWQLIVESHHHHEVILRTKLQTLETCIGQARG